MPANTKSATTRDHGRESSFVSLLSGWMQQGVDSFFATQRILLDLAMRQNASVVHLLRDRLTDPQHSPTAIATELAGEGMANFIEAQKVLLNLAQEQNGIVMDGVKERIGESTGAGAMTEFLRRSVDTFISMQENFLKIASKQAETLLETARSGKPYKSDDVIQVARESMDTFVHAQKRFLDVVSEQIAVATGAKRPVAMKKIKKTELADQARKASEAFVDAQKKLFDVAGHQMNTNLKIAGRTTELMKPLPFVGLADITKQGVKSYVDAQKALMDVMLKQRNGHKPETKVEHKKRRPTRSARKETAKAAVAG